MKSRTLSTCFAFTMVELLIVIIILGILASIVVPRPSSATMNARNTGAISQLTSSRKQLEVWRLDHQGNFPTLAQLQQGAADWAVLVRKTTVDGTLDDEGLLGPYLSSPPLNPYTSSSLVVEAGASANSVGWTFDEDSGELKIVLPTIILPEDTTLGIKDYEQPAGD